MTTNKKNSSDQKAENNKDNKVDVAPYLSKNNNKAKVNNTNNSGSGLKTAGILSLVVIVGTTAYVMFNNKGIEVAETTSTPGNIEQNNLKDQTAATMTKSDSPDISENLNTIPADRPLEDTQLDNVESGMANKNPDNTENVIDTNVSKTKPSDSLTNIPVVDNESDSDSVISSFFSYLYQDIQDIFGSENESSKNNDKSSTSSDTGRTINQEVKNSEHAIQSNKATDATQVSGTGKTAQTNTALTSNRSNTQPTSIIAPSNYPPQGAYAYPQPPYYPPYGGYYNPAYPPASPYTYQPRWAEPGAQTSPAQNSNYNSRNYHDERVNFYRQRHQAWLDSHQQRSRTDLTETPPAETTENN